MRAHRYLSACVLSVLAISVALEASGQSQGKWVVRAPMTSSRTEVAVVEVGGKLYVIGGFGQGGDLVEEYDPDKDSWRRRASLPRALHHVGAAAVAGKIYVIGGYISGFGAVDTVYEYSPGSDQWRSRASMPTARLLQEHSIRMNLMIPPLTAGPPGRRCPRPVTAWAPQWWESAST